MVMLNIERRVAKLEEHLSRADRPKTLEDMFQAFKRGDYGPYTLMSIVADVLSSSDPNAALESLRNDMPDTLVDWFVNQFNRQKTGDEEVNGK
jgi:hypothetical protein